MPTKTNCESGGGEQLIFVYVAGKDLYSWMNWMTLRAWERSGSLFFAASLSRGRVSVRADL